MKIVVTENDEIKRQDNSEFIVVHLSYAVGNNECMAR